MRCVCLSYSSIMYWCAVCRVVVNCSCGGAPEIVLREPYDGYSGTHPMNTTIALHVLIGHIKLI